MPTNRQRRTRNRKDADVPPWARRLRETGKPPDRGTAADHQYIGWEFFRDDVPGLPLAKDVEEWQNGLPILDRMSDDTGR